MRRGSYAASPPCTPEFHCAFDTCVGSCVFVCLLLPPIWVPPVLVTVVSLLLSTGVASLPLPPWPPFSRFLCSLYPNLATMSPCRGCFGLCDRMIPSLKASVAGGVDGSFRRDFCSRGHFCCPLSRGTGISSPISRWDSSLLFPLPAHWWLKWRRRPHPSTRFGVSES